MSQQLINLGAQPDDNTGDDARSGGRKINENFSELYGKVQNVQNLNLTGGPVTALPAGSAPTATITGTYPNHQLALGLPLGPTGLPGAGAPTSADILSLADRDDLMREIAGAGVPDRPIAILDFTRGVQWVKGAYAGASILALVAAIPGSLYARASTATYFDADGLMKTAAVNVPRIDYDPVTRVCRGYLREPSRVNLARYSEQLDNAAWGKYRVSVVPNAAVAPDGLSTADKVVEDTAASNTHNVAADVTTSPSTQYWLSIFVKAAERTRCEVGSLIFAGQDERTAVAIDLITGSYTVSGVNPAAKVENCGNGWWRVSVKSLRNATISDSRLSVSLADAGGNTIYTGDGASGIYVWGGQVEEGSSSSSYIQTTASAVTRAVESLQVSTPAWLNLPEGTILTEFEAIQPPAGTNDFAFTLTVGTLADFIAVYRTSSGSGNGYVRSISGSVTQISSTANMPWPVTPAARGAVAWKAGDAAWAWESGLAGSNNAYVVPLGMPLLVLSSSGAVNSAWLKRILIYPRRLSNAKLQALTNQSLWS